MSEEMLIASDLSPKQKTFCIEFVKCGIGSSAAIAAGYSKSTARNISGNLLRNEKIQNYIEELLKTVTSCKIMDMEETLMRVTAIARNEETEEVVFPDFKTGKSVTVKKDVCIKDRIRALELMSKILGLYKDTSIASPITVQIIDSI
jgi:phage terminase small subunit